MSFFSGAKILISRFPLESAFGGEEKGIQRFLNNFPVFFWGTCPVLFRLFPRKQRLFAPGVFDITCKKNFLILPFPVLSLLIQGAIVLPLFRLSGGEIIIMHTFIEKVLLTGWARLWGLQVFWAHHAGLGPWFFQHPLLSWWRFFSAKVTILVPSSFLQKELKKARPLGRIVVLPNPIVSSQKKYQGPLWENPFQKPTLVVGGAGRIVPEKGFSHFLLLAHAFPHVLFVLAGEGSDRKDIEKKAPPNLLFLGFCNEEKMGRFWEDIDLFISFSEHETFGMVAAEAALAGIPFLIPPSDGFQEIGKKDPRFFFHDQEDLFKKIQYYQEKPSERKKMGERAKAISILWSEPYWKKSVEKFIFWKKSQQWKKKDTEVAIRKKQKETPKKSKNKY